MEIQPQNPEFRIDPENFQPCIKLANSLDSDQAKHFVRPDLFPSCLQMLLVPQDKSLLSCKAV